VWNGREHRFAPAPSGKISTSHGLENVLPRLVLRRSHVATHQIEVMIPEDRRLVIEVPETIRSGPATLILVTSSAGPLEAEELPESTRIEARNRWQAARAELARDSRPFRQLSPEERRDRLRRLQGIGRGLLSSSEEFARRKAEEIEIEERKLAR